MKLEFLKNINGYGEHAVRLSDFNSAQALSFRQAIDRLIERGEKIDLSSLDFIEPVNCTLILRISSEDQGITYSEKKEFFCDLTVGSYRDMLDLLQPFCIKESKSYQWLYDIDNPIGFLFSAGKDIPV